MKDIQFKILSRNVIEMTQKQNQKIVKSFFVIPSGVNRTDIITQTDLKSGYNYNADVILIITDETTRQIFYKNKLQIKYKLNDYE